MRGSEYWLRGFLVVFVLLSLSLVGWGSHKGNNLDVYMILVTIGSAFLGVSAGMFLDRLIAFKTTDDALSVVKENMHDIKRAILHEDLLTSNQDSINNIIGEWHQYNVTKKSGEYYWVHALYNIKSTPFGEILFEVEYKNNKGNSTPYIYSGFVRDERAVLVGSPKDVDQPCFIEIWPHLTNHASEYHCGFCLNQSWDFHETLIPCIMSRKPLTNKNRIDNQKLDKLWRQGVSGLNLSLLPRILNSQQKDNHNHEAYIKS